MLPAAVIGALIGSVLNRRISAEKITVIYNAAVVFMIGMNIFNLLTFAGVIPG